MSEITLYEAQVREAVVDTILLTTHNGLDCGPNPTPISDVAQMIVEDVLRPLIADRDAAVARAETAEQAVQRVRAETAEAIAQAIEAEYADSPWIRTAIDIARQHAKGDGDG